jgi:ATP-binding cassette subfamily B protein RaxB
MIASAYGHNLDINEVRHRFHVSLKGTTLKDVMAFGRALGLSSRALRLELSALDRLRCPAMLHMDMNHFVVLKEMRNGYALVHDPAIGVRKLNPEQLERRFTGVALELAPNESFVPKDVAPPLRLTELVGRLPFARGTLGKAFALSLAMQILVLAAPFYVQLVIDRSVTQGDTEALIPIGIGFALLVALRAAVGWVRAKTLLALAGYLSAQLVSNVVRHMLRLPQSWFESRHVAALLSRLSSTQPVRDLLAEGLAAAIVDGLMAILTLILALLFVPFLALVALTGFIATALVRWWQVRRSIDREHEYIEAFAAAQQDFIETVRAIATVKLFRKEAERERRWADRHVESINARFAADTIKARADLARDLIHAAVFGAVVYIGATQTIAGTLTLGMLMAFITYQQMFADSSSKLLDFAARFRLLDVHLQRLADVVRSDPEIDDAAVHGDIAEPLGGRISADDLSYRYADHEKPVFSNVSFDIASGEFVAITGPSGGGKTTLLKLIVGLLEPSAGTIAFDGQPVRNIGLATLRDEIGVVMQDDVLLSGSLAQNITFFEAQPDIPWMHECARLAAIHEDIVAFPMAYNTLVGDLGSVLSVGQRQRILLARALYKRPRILFMDEGTSSLDIDKEQEVNRNLQALEITRMVIAHRKDTIDSADRILELTDTGMVLRDSLGKDPVKPRR